MEKIKNYIGGELLDPINGKFLDNINPATGEIYSFIPDSSEEDVKLAIEKASFAFPSWAALSKEERSLYLRKIAKKIEDNIEKLALAESIDNGKPLSLATKVDIPRSALNFNFFAEEILKFDGYYLKTNEHTNNHITYSPLGVVSCISPWNLPLYLFTWKIAPALAAGNTVVAKPSEITPMSAFLLSKICQEINLPPGVLNIIHGKGADLGPTMTTHTEIKAISFTGSTATGREIAKSAAPYFKKVSLEMGGKNPNIIFSDCDFEKTLATTVRSSFSNQGQICLCGSRIFVESSLYDKFKNKFIEKAKKLIVGDPLQEKTNLGALVSKEHMNKVLSYIDLAQKEGGTILCGGEQLHLKGKNKNGYFVAPTIIEGLNPSAQTNLDEIFGPVVTITPFENEKDLITWANCTRYGLSASIWSKDIEKAKSIAKKLNSGIVWINTWMNRDLRTPFGGTKESGIGREGGQYALQFFSEIKNTCIED